MGSAVGLQVTAALQAAHNDEEEADRREAGDEEQQDKGERAGTPCVKST